MRCNAENGSSSGNGFHVLGQKDRLLSQKLYGLSFRSVAAPETSMIPFKVVICCCVSLQLFRVHGTIHAGILGLLGY